MPTNFDDIVFDEASHTYSLYGQSLTGVTRMLSRLKPPFDAPAVAACIAERDGRAVADVLAEWEQQRQAAMARGIRVHHYIAAKIRSAGDISPGLPAADQHQTLPRLPEMDAFDRWWAERTMSYSDRIVEWVVGDAGLGVAGTVDTMLRDEQTADTVIFDWKTGHKFTTETPWENLHLPFEDLPHCDLSVYSLQISLYRLIIDRNRAGVKAAYILHLAADGQATMYAALDLRERLTAWLSTGAAVR